MEKRRVTVLKGDGIGPEVVSEAIRVVDATGVAIDWDYQLLGAGAGEDPLPQKTIESIDMNRIALKGPTATPTACGYRSVNVRLRERFQLYTNVRPVHTMPGVKTRFSDVPIDIFVFRENLEDLYIGEERRIKNGFEATARFTACGCENIARYAFNFANTQHRKKVTIVHKANILKQTHGLFREVAMRVAHDFPNIECNDLIADNFMMQLIRNPERFDCVLLPNLFGDLASDLCAGLIGGLGFAPGANIGYDCAIFEAVHGTAPDIAGRGIANPTAIILSAAMMLDHIYQHDAAARIRKAIDAVLRDGTCVTGDVKPGHGVSTKRFTDAVIAKL